MACTMLKGRMQLALLVMVLGLSPFHRCYGQLEPTPARVERLPGSGKLRSLEAAAALRSVKSSAPLSAKEYSGLVTAAHTYAAAVAGADDAQFTKLAATALSQGIAAKRGLLDVSTAIGPPVARAFDIRLSRAPPAEQVWALPSFQANYRELMNAAAKSDSGLFPISGPPSTARIVGTGTQLVSSSAFRDCVCVGVRLGTVDKFCCTGTLIGKNVVVTAGHCFFCVAGGAENAVVFFGTDTSQPGKRVTGKAFRHPQYNQNGQNNDLSVIILDQPIEDIAPRRLATTSEIDRSTFVRAVGFGNSDFASSGGFGIKRMVDVPVASICCCGETDPTHFGCDEELELVAGFVGLGPDSCNGDSGGPIYVLVGDDARDDASWAVAGVTSRATDLATRPCGDGGIYARLDQYLDFIRNLPGAEF